MKLVINIPDYIKEKADDGKGEEFGIPLWLVYEIANGTPLPKGHGDLIDRDDLLADSYCVDDWAGNEINIVDVMTVKMTDAIIEADKGEADGK